MTIKTKPVKAQDMADIVVAENKKELFAAIKKHQNQTKKH